MTTLQEDDMEFGTIEREIFVEAEPETVFDVVSSPEHLKQWWPDDASFEPSPGSSRQLVFGDREAGAHIAALTVLDVEPPTTFTFRWTHPAAEVAATGNSLLVTFSLTPARGGTLLRMTESGFREMGWEAALLEQQYNDHVSGWEFYLPRLAPYLEKIGVQA